MYRHLLITLWLLVGSNSFAQTAEKMNIHYMKMGSCTVQSGIKDTTAAGGFAPSDNHPKSLQHDTDIQAFKSIQARHNNMTSALVLDTVSIANFGNRYQGYQLYLMNTRHEALQLNAQDSRLNLLAEAWVDGKWQLIEYMPKVTCGNSKHKVYLPSGYYWQFTVPRYEGAIATRIRYRLALPNGFFLYSAEVKASINREQLKVKKAD